MIETIREKFNRREYEYSLHAVDQSILKQISPKEIEEAVANGRILEDYPTDKYGPSCLIFGLTTTGRPLHVHCTHPTRPKVKIITVYQPDATEWIDFTIRRPG
jgi:hypothetical protein